MEIRIGRIRLASIRNNAGFFQGKNTMRGWLTRAKSNAALGRISGDRNYIASSLNMLYDADVVDFYTGSPPPGEGGGETGQQGEKDSTPPSKT